MWYITLFNFNCDRFIFSLYSVFQTSNPAWSPLFYHAPFPERLKDLSVKSWSQLAGSGPVPWRQAPSLFNPSAAQSELQTRMPYEVDRLNTGERFSAPSLEKRKVEDFSEKFINGNLRIRLQDIVENGNAGTDPLPTFYAVSRKEVHDDLAVSCCHAWECYRNNCKLIICCRNHW